MAALAAAPGRVAVHYVQDEQECIAFLRVDVSFEDAKEKLNEKLQPDYDKNEYLIYYATYPNAAGASIKSYINDADDYSFMVSQQQQDKCELHAAITKVGVRGKRATTVAAAAAGGAGAAGEAAGAATGSSTDSTSTTSGGGDKEKEGAPKRSKPTKGKSKDSDTAPALTAAHRQVATDYSILGRQFAATARLPHEVSGSGDDLIDVPLLISPRPKAIATGDIVGRLVTDLSNCAGGIFLICPEDYENFVRIAGDAAAEDCAAIVVMLPHDESCTTLMFQKQNELIIAPLALSSVETNKIDKPVFFAQQGADGGAKWTELVTSPPNEITLSVYRRNAAALRTPTPDSSDSSKEKLALRASLAKRNPQWLTGDEAQLLRVLHAGYYKAANKALFDLHKHIVNPADVSDFKRLLCVLCGKLRGRTANRLTHNVDKHECAEADVDDYEMPPEVKDVLKLHGLQLNAASAANVRQQSTDELLRHYRSQELVVDNSATYAANTVDLAEQILRSALLRQLDPAALKGIRAHNTPELFQLSCDIYQMSSERSMQFIRQRLPLFRPEAVKAALPAPARGSGPLLDVLAMFMRGSLACGLIEGQTKRPVQLLAGGRLAVVHCLVAFDGVMLSENVGYDKYSASVTGLSNVTADALESYATQGRPVKEFLAQHPLASSATVYMLVRTDGAISVPLWVNYHDAKGGHAAVASALDEVCSVADVCLHCLDAVLEEYRNSGKPLNQRELLAAARLRCVRHCDDCRDADSNTACTRCSDLGLRIGKGVSRPCIPCLSKKQTCVVCEIHAASCDSESSQAKFADARLSALEITGPDSPPGVVPVRDIYHLAKNARNSLQNTVLFTGSGQASSFVLQVALKSLTDPAMLPGLRHTDVKVKDKHDFEPVRRLVVAARGSSPQLRQQDHGLIVSTISPRPFLAEETAVTSKDKVLDMAVLFQSPTVVLLNNELLIISKSTAKEAVRVKLPANVKRPARMATTGKGRLLVLADGAVMAFEPVNWLHHSISGKKLEAKKLTVTLFEGAPAFRAIDGTIDNMVVLSTNSKVAVGRVDYEKHLIVVQESTICTLSNEPILDVCMGVGGAYYVLTATRLLTGRVVSPLVHHELAELCDLPGTTAYSHRRLGFALGRVWISSGSNVLAVDPTATGTPVTPVKLLTASSTSTDGFALATLGTQASGCNIVALACGVDLEWLDIAGSLRHITPLAATLDYVDKVLGSLIDACGRPNQHLAMEQCISFVKSAEAYIDGTLLARPQNFGNLAGAVTDETVAGVKSVVRSLELLSKRSVVGMFNGAVFNELVCETFFGLIVQHGGGSAGRSTSMSQHQFGAALTSAANSWLRIHPAVGTSALTTFNKTYPRRTHTMPLWLAPLELTFLTRRQCTPSSAVNADFLQHVQELRADVGPVRKSRVRPLTATYSFNVPVVAEQRGNQLRTAVAILPALEETLCSGDEDEGDEDSGISASTTAAAAAVRAEAAAALAARSAAQQNGAGAEDDGGEVAGEDIEPEVGLDPRLLVVGVDMGILALESRRFTFWLGRVLAVDETGVHFHYYNTEDGGATYFLDPTWGERRESVDAILDTAVLDDAGSSGSHQHYKLAEDEESRLQGLVARAVERRQEVARQQRTAVANVQRTEMLRRDEEGLPPRISRSERPGRRRHKDDEAEGGMASAAAVPAAGVASATGSNGEPSAKRVKRRRGGGR